MKAILEFNLPEEKSEFKLASNANDLYCVLWDLDNELRRLLKYNEQKHNDDVLIGLEMARNKLNDLFIDYNLEW